MVDDDALTTTLFAPVAGPARYHNVSNSVLSEMTFVAIFVIDTPLYVTPVRCVDESFSRVSTKRSKSDPVQVWEYVRDVPGATLPPFVALSKAIAIRGV